MRRERVRGGHPFDGRGIRRLRGDGKRHAFGLPRPSLTAVHSRASFLRRTRRPAGFRLYPQPVRSESDRDIGALRGLIGHSRTDTTQQYLDEVGLDELAEALERAAAKRHAQAPPDLTTLGSEISTSLERLEWRRRESNPRPRTHRQSVYKLRLPLIFARRPVGSRPTAGLAILWCRASGDWLSLGAEPVFDAATRTTGRVRSDALSY